MPWRLIYLARMLRLRPRRYRHLLRTVFQHRCRRILEVGTWNGVHARQMIETARIFHAPERIDYHGFDLFEHLTDEALVREASKRPPAEEAVRRGLTASGARIRLHVGNTRDTLPAYLREPDSRNEPFDLAFIDGGHSFETIASDWECVARLMTPRTITLFDDHYANSREEVGETGCQELVASLDPARYHVRVLDPEDTFRKDWGTLRVRLVEVRLRSGR